MTTETSTPATTDNNKPFIPSISSKASQDTLSELLLEHGAIVVADIFSDTERSMVIAELEPFLAKTTLQTTDDPDEFYPANTKRAAALVRKSETVHKMITNPSLMGICNNILLPNCERFQLHVSSALVSVRALANRFSIEKMIPLNSSKCLDPTWSSPACGQ